MLGKNCLSIKKRSILEAISSVFEFAMFKSRLVKAKRWKWFNKMTNLLLVHKRQLLRTEPSASFSWKLIRPISILISYSKICQIIDWWAGKQPISNSIKHTHSDPPALTRWSPNIHIVGPWSPSWFWPVAFVPFGPVIADPKPNI